MRRNIFTSYIISNCLNLKTFFEPIIDFIEIGKPRYSPLRTVYENFISYGSNRKTKIQVLSDMCSKLTNCMIHSFLPIRKNKNLKALYCGYNAKISSWLIHLYVDRASWIFYITYFLYCYFSFCVMILYDCFLYYW